jgi:4'-phosphopantetheinyl transferase
MRYDEVIKLNNSSRQLINSLENDVHIWLAFPGENTNTKLTAQWEQILSKSERERYARFHFDRDRHLYLLGHVLVRKTLSRYFPVPPEKWTFKLNQFGRPEIYKPEFASRLRFNLSTTKGLVACMIGFLVDIGVDVENISKNINYPQTLARNVLSRTEIRDFKRLSEKAFQKKLFTYWTLKEAYLKAVGTGLSYPLTNFEFRLEHDGKAQISFNSLIQDHPENWQFDYYQPTPTHILAAAIRKQTKADLGIKIFKN